MEAQFSWWSIIQFALGAGVISAVVNQIIEGIRDYRKANAEINRSAAYSTIRIATTLEAYALKCAHVLSYYENEEMSGVKLPEIDSYESDVEWKSLNPSLVSRALSLPVEIKSGHSSLHFWNSVIPESADGFLIEEIAGNGYRAWELATEFRSYYKIAELNLDYKDWIVAILNKHLKK